MDMRPVRYLRFLVPLLFILQACGTSLPVLTPSPSPSASTSDLEPESDFSDTFVPYGKNIRFDQISLEEGLSQSVVNAILQDRKGFLWVGTDDGLNRYNGYSFTVFKPDADNPASLSDRSITAIAEDPNGNLWIGTRQGGLNRYDPLTGNFTPFLHNNEADDTTVASNLVYSLWADQSGIWIGTDNGLDYLEYESGKFTHYRVSDDMPPADRSLSSNIIRALFMDSKGQLWIGTGSGGLNLFNPRTKSFKVYKQDKANPGSLSGNRVLSITEDSNGYIWVGTTNGLNQFNPTRNIFRRFENSRYKEFSIAGNTIYALHIDRSGGLWVGTNKGLDRYDPETSKFIHHQSQPGISLSLSNNQVQAIHEDSSGVLWIGTYGGGLNKYNRQQDRFAYYRHNPNDNNSLSSNFILAILAEKRDYIWIGTFDNGLNRFEPATEKFTHFESNPGIPASLSDNSINALYQDSKGTLWVGTGSALDRFDHVTSRFTHFKPEPAEDTENPVFFVTHIFEDSSKRFWVGTNQGLMRFNRDTGKFFEFNLGGLDPDESPNNITAMVEDKHGNLWVGTFDDGLKRIDRATGSVTHFRSDPNKRTSLGNNAILCLHLDSYGALWVGTHGGGLDRLDVETGIFSHFTENEGLPNNVIYGILEDESEHFWLSTNFGLSRFDPLALTFRNFTASDGLQSNEFNQNAFAKDANGRMYFGGINGLNIFEPREIRDNPYPPNISLTAVTFDGEPLVAEFTPEYMDRIVLQWPHDSFEFEFSAFAFEQPSKNKYSYLLEGFDPGWIEIGSQRNGRYTNLPGGTYTLRLRGSNSDGTWNESANGIEVVVVPPFWETWWFGGLMLVAFGIMTAAGLRWRVKRVENRNLELERVVKLRTVDLEKRNSEIEALYLADEKIIRSVTLNQIFQTLVNVSVSVLQADRSVVLAWNEEKRKIMPRVSQGFHPESLPAMRYELDEGKIGLAMSTGAPVIVSDIELDNLRPDIREVIIREGIQSFAHFPIVVDERVVAIFNVAYTRPDALTKDSIRLFTALVNRASMAIANMELFDQTRELAVMEERNRLARDLHDSAKQKAFAALAQLGTVNGIAGAVPQGADPHLTEAETLVYEVIQELNFLIQEIYPIALQEKGLPAVLREYVFEWENRNDAMINLSIQNERELPLELEQAVYRVIQEALANVSRHSRAGRVDLSLVYNGDMLQVMMADDGRGFDINKKATGLGFRSMRERIGSIRGNFQVQSAPGQGTRILVQIPLKTTTGATK